MAFNSVGTFNASFIGSSSSKPICGVIASDYMKLKIQQAKNNVADTAILVPGMAITIKNTALSGTAAGKGLNPNVLTIEKAANATGIVIDGFLLESPTDVMLDGDLAAHPVQGQIVNVALVGSGIELYLPAADDLVNVDVTADKYWNYTNLNLTASPSGALVVGKLEILSPVVDGIQFSVNNNKAIYKNTKCVKVRL